MTADRQLAEYQALRGTIQQRGSVRIWAILAGLAAWAALALGLATLDAQRAVTLLPFLVLVATFEINFFIHTGVERIGRYLQVNYDDRWETTVMAYGHRFPGGTDPLLVKVFALCAAANFLTVLTAPNARPGWIAISLVATLMLVWRLLSARKRASAQRATDLERFRALKTPPASN